MQFLSSGFHRIEIENCVFQKQHKQYTKSDDNEIDQLKEIVTPKYNSLRNDFFFAFFCSQKCVRQ